MAPKPTVNLPALPMPDVDLGLDADRDLGQFVADAKLKVTEQSFESRYQQGISSFFESNAPEPTDLLLGEQAAALMVEGSRRALLQTVKKTGIYSAILVSVWLLVRLPLQTSPIVIFPAVVAAVCNSKRG